MANHSSIVGGSTASRVIKCPGSVALVAKMPPKPSSKYADEGTLLHNTIADILQNDIPPANLLGTKYKEHVLVQEHLDNKIFPALEKLNEIDPDCLMDMAIETEVHFGDLLPGVFGSADVLGKLNRKAFVIDWKFGDGVIVEAEENYQGMFYAAAAMHTPEVNWVFEDVDEVEIVIIQPPMMRRWVTTVARIKEFERDLIVAVKESEKLDARIEQGSHCRWCAAKPVCPVMTGAVDRAMNTQLKSIDAKQISYFLDHADTLEQWIADLRALAHQMLEADIPVPGYKLVAKRATRQWAHDEETTKNLLNKAGLLPIETVTEKVITPAQAEKELKKHKKELPKELVVSISSGSTLAPESDPRPAVLQIGKQLNAALNKLN